MHYHQAAMTPMVSGPIAGKIGPFNDNDFCNTILHGTFDMANITTTSEVKDIVAGMCYPDPPSLMMIFSKQYSICGSERCHPHPVDTTAIIGHSCVTLLYLDALHQLLISVSSGVFLFTNGRK